MHCSCSVQLYMHCNAQCNVCIHAFYAACCVAPHSSPATGRALPAAVLPAAVAPTSSGACFATIATHRKLLNFCQYYYCYYYQCLPWYAVATAMRVTPLLQSPAATNLQACGERCQQQPQQQRRRQLRRRQRQLQRQLGGRVHTAQGSAPCSDQPGGQSRRRCCCCYSHSGRYSCPPRGRHDLCQLRRRAREGAARAAWRAQRQRGAHDGAGKGAAGASAGYR